MRYERILPWLRVRDLVVVSWLVVKTSRRSRRLDVALCGCLSVVA